MNSISLLPIFAEDPTGIMSARWWEGFAGSVLYGLLGIGLVVLAVKIFDWMSPKIDVQVELAEKKNMAVAVVVAALIAGVCYLMATVVY